MEEKKIGLLYGRNKSVSRNPKEDCGNGSNRWSWMGSGSSRYARGEVGGSLGPPVYDGG